MTFTPSAYQQAIFEFVEQHQQLIGTPQVRNLAIDALAGSGKSTSLIQLLKLLDSRQGVLFCAFSKLIQEHLKAKLVSEGVFDVDVSTIHSLGLRMLNTLWGKAMPVTIEDKKYLTLVKDVMSRQVVLLSDDSLNDIQSALLDLAKFCRLTLTNPNDHAGVLQMAAHFGITPYPDALRLLPGVIEVGDAMATEGYLLDGQTVRLIDFNDMLWLPHRLNLHHPSPYKLVLVDEAQDLSAAQYGIVERVLARHGMVVAVGDKNQAIMGFAGAGHDSFDQLTYSLSATVLPLSICYRCSTSVIQQAQTLVPHIEARPGAPEGRVNHITEKRLMELVTTERCQEQRYWVLCRLNAPLVGMCVQLLQAGISANIIGNDVGASLKKRIKELGKAHHHMPLMTRIIQVMSDKTRAMKLNGADEMAVIVETDYWNTLLEFVKSYPEVQSLDDLQAKIDYLMPYHKDGSKFEPSTVVLTTAHRSKGLEAENVFIINPELLPWHRDDQLPWQIQQEQNLAYVAWTRAMLNLYFVEG